MSELIQKHDNRATIRWKLLTGVSALALTAYVSSTAIAGAEDASRPQIWIELGAQLNGSSGSQEAFAPDFSPSPPRPSIFSPSQGLEKPPAFGMDEFGQISFQPEDSNWSLLGLHPLWPCAEGPAQAPADLSSPPSFQPLSDSAQPLSVLPCLQGGPQNAKPCRG